MSASPPLTFATSKNGGSEENQDAVDVQRAWIRFQRVYTRRKAFFHRPDLQTSKTTQRLFILSHNDDPWEIFGLTSRLDYRQRVYEICGLHFTTLHDACINGDRRRVQRLLSSIDSGDTERECSLLARDSSGRVPLHHAVIREHHGITQLLLKQPNARLQLHMRDNRDAPPVQYVMEKLHRLALKESPSSTLPGRATRLFSQSQRFQNLWTVADRMLLSMELRLVEELRSLDCGVRGDAWDAVRAGDVDRLRTIHQLYDQETESGPTGYSLLHHACAATVHENVKVVLYLIAERGLDRTQQTTSGATPLHCAATCGWLEACVLLLDEERLDNPIDPDDLLLATDKCGRTPLHACLQAMGRGRKAGSRSDTLMTARYLVGRCPQALHGIDYDGYTPLHYAVCSGDVVLVELMISLGANVFHEIILERGRSEYGRKADWAPCGSRFQRAVDQPLDSKPRKSEDQRPAATNLQPVAPSMACVRMHKVKAGQLEHPGEAIPMETLWFLLRRPPTKHGEQHETTAINSTRRATVTDDATDKIGCRRFGALCDRCQSKGGDSTDSKAARTFPPCREDGVVASALVLAIRSCRFGVVNSTTLEERLAVIEILLLAGSAIDDAAIHEALRAVETPCVVQLLMTYSGQLLTRDHLIPHFFPAFGDYLTTPDRRQSMLLDLLDTHPELFDASLLFSLFRWGYVRVVERMLELNPHAGMHEMWEIPHFLNASRKSRRQPRITTRHLEQLLVWKARWPVQSTAFAALGCKCVEALLVQPMIRNGPQRQHTDEMIAAAVIAFSTTNNWVLNYDEVTVEWLSKAIRLGLIVTASALWTTIRSTPRVVVSVVTRLLWPLRMPFMHADFADGFAQKLLETIVNCVDHKDVTIECLVTCLAVACIYTMPLSRIQVLFIRLQQLDQESRVVELLVSTRFGGFTLSQWIVRRDRVDVAKILLAETESSADLKEQLWRAVSFATMATSPVSLDRWQALLFPRPDASSELLGRRQWLLKCLIRVRPCPALLVALADWVLLNDQGGREFGWLEIPSLVHDMARWNALGLIQHLLASQSDPSIWSRLVTKRSDADSCTPIELCEMLGHYELGRLMRRLVSTDDRSLPAQETRQEKPWPQHHPRHFGLLHTFLSRPLIATPTTPVSARQVQTNSLAAFSGDWTAAVALNSIRLLEVLHDHDIPLTINEEDVISSNGKALASLLEVAITHASLETIQWLLREMASAIEIPKSRSRELLFKAAKHTSPIYAAMTLELLQHPGIDPGRLSGDGDDATLLHRVACFSDPQTGSAILTQLLAIEGSDVNARDGVGSTVIEYALASGTLATVCFLLSHHSPIRLEAEFEGQTAFYYTLQLLPSLAWRWLLQTLLMAKCHAASLHCTANDCGCKGFERIREETSGSPVGSVCAFCSHAFESHTRIPFPPWFRDQYDTYLDSRCALTNANNTNDTNDTNDGGDEEDEDEEVAAQRRLRALLETPLEDEAMLEDSRGRLYVHDLERITLFRFHDLVTTHALVLSPASSLTPKDSVDDLHANHTYPAWITMESEPTGAPAQDSDTNLDAPDTVNTAVDASDDAASSPDLPWQDSSRVPLLEPPQAPPLPPISLALLPWFLRGDVAMVVRTSSLSGHFNMCVHTTASGQLRAVLTQWLRLTSTESMRLQPKRDMTPTTLATAFAWWQDMTISSTVPATSTCGSFHKRVEKREGSIGSGSSGTPVASDSTVLQTSSSASTAVTMTGTSITAASAIGSRNTINTNKSVSMLQLLVHHWRYARVYQCFRLWKRWCESANAEVALHALETLGDTWAADARRVRFQLLLTRQRALEASVKRVFE